MRDFYEPVYGSYQSPPAFQQAQDHLKKSSSGGSSSSGGNVLGRFLKLGKSKSDANGHGLKSRSRPTSYQDDFEEDFRLTSTKSPVERMVHKVNSRKDVSKSHSWIYGSVKLPSDLPFGYGYTSGFGPGNTQSQMHIPRCQKMDYCGSCDCTSDFDFVTPGASSAAPHSHGHNHNHNHNHPLPPPPPHLQHQHHPHHNHPPPGPGMNFEGSVNCQGCHPYYGAIECGKPWVSGGGSRKEKDGSQLTMLENGKKFGNSVRKLTWKSLKQVVKKRPTLDVLKKSTTPSPSMYSSSSIVPKDMSSGGSHDDLLGSNYFFPEKKSFYASCTDLYGESPPHVTASVRVRPKRARQPWPFPNEFGPVPNYQEEEIYHSEWDLRQFMPYDVWLTATNNPHLNPASIASTSTTKIPKINRALPAASSSNNNCSSSPSNLPNSNSNSNPNSNNNNNPNSNNNNNNNNTNNNNNVMKNKGMSSSSSAIYGYGQAIVKRSSILHTDVTAYQLIKSQQRGSHMKDGKDKGERRDHENGEQSDSDDLSDNVLTEDPVRIGGQGIYMVSTVNPSIAPGGASSNASSNNSSARPSPNPSSMSSSSGSSSVRKIGSGDVGGWAETSSQRHQSSKQTKHMSPDRSNSSSSNRMTDLYESGASSTNSINNNNNNINSVSNNNNNGTGLKTYLSQPPTGGSNGSGNGSSVHYVANSNPAAAQGKKFNQSPRQVINDKCGGAGPGMYVENKNNATSESHPEYHSTFEYDSMSYDSSSSSMTNGPSQETQTKSHEAASTPTPSSSVTAGGHGKDEIKQSGHNSSSHSRQGENNASGSSNNSGSGNSNNNNNNNKYGALKRRKSRSGSSNNKNLFKETIYEEDSEHSEETSGRSKEVHTVKIVVSQTVTSEYVKPILKKERVYETPCIEGRTFHPSSSSSSHTCHPSHDSNGFNGSGNYSDVCSDGQQQHPQYPQSTVQTGGTRSTKKVQFDQTKLVVCGGLSEEDDGDESDDTLVKDYGDDKESDWIVEEPMNMNVQMQSESQIPHSNGFHMAAQNDSTFASSNSQISFELHGKNISALEEVIRNDGVNNPVGSQHKPGHIVSSYGNASHAHSETNHGQGTGSYSNDNKNPSRFDEGLNVRRAGGRAAAAVPTAVPVTVARPMRDEETKGGNTDEMQMQMQKQKQGAEEKLRIQSRKNETPHVIPLKADRIANVPERKTVKASSGEKIINPNSLLFHDTTRIRLNQTRPSLDQTFKLNLSSHPGGSKNGNGNVNGTGSKSGSGGVSRMMSRLKQSSSFRNPVGSALRPREPPPPPPVPLHLSSRSSVSSSGVSAYAQPQTTTSKDQQSTKTSTISSATATATATAAASATGTTTKVGFSKQNASRSIGSSAASSKLQKTLSNIAKIDRKQGSSGSKSVPSPAENLNRPSAAEISLPIGCTTTAAVSGKNGLRMRGIEDVGKGVEGSHNSTANYSTDHSHFNGTSANGTRKSSVVATPAAGVGSGSGSVYGSGSGQTAEFNNNRSNGKNVKVPPTRSKSLAERCKAVEKVLAQHSPFSSSSSSSPQSHEEKQSKESIRSNNHNLGKHILETHQVLSPTTPMTRKNEETSASASASATNGNQQSFLSTSNRRCSNNESKSVSSNSHYFNNDHNEYETDKKESYSSRTSSNSSVTMNSTNAIRGNANLTNHSQQSNPMMNSQECIYDDTAKNIEIVTKENSVSEIRIYSSTQNMNINHNSESAQILSNYMGSGGSHDSRVSQDNKIEEIHYAATDVVYSMGSHNQTETESRQGIHFRQASAPSSLHSSRPQSTSVVLIIGTGSSEQQQHQHQHSSSTMNVRDTPVSSTSSNVTRHFDEERSYLDSTSSPIQEIKPVPRGDGEEGGLKRNDDKTPIDMDKSCLTTEGRTNTRSMENLCEVEEPLYDDVISHATRQPSKATQLSEQQGKKHSSFSSPLFESLQRAKDLTEKTANALSKTYSKNLNKFPLPPPPPVPTIPPPPLLPANNTSNNKNNNNNNNNKNSNNNNMKNSYMSSSSMQPMESCEESEACDNLYNDIELSLPPQNRTPAAAENKKKGTQGFSGVSNGPINYGGRDDGIIYDDTLSVVSSNYGRSIMDGKINGLIEVDEVGEDEPLYDDVLNLLAQDSDSGAETEDSPPPPLPAQGPPVHLLPKVSMDLPLLNFPLLNPIEKMSSGLGSSTNTTINSLSTTSMSTTLPGRLRSVESFRKTQSQDEDITVRSAGDQVVAQDLLVDPKSSSPASFLSPHRQILTKDELQSSVPAQDHNHNHTGNGVELAQTGQNNQKENNHRRSNNDMKTMTGLNGFLQVLSPSSSSSASSGSSGSSGGSHTSSTADIQPEMEEDDVLDRTRTLLNELNEKLTKLNFPSADYSTYISKVVISSSSESSGVEEDYNSEKNYSLSNSSDVACFDENYRLNAVSKLVSETISMARGKFLDSMKLPTANNSGGGSSSSGNSSGSGCVNSLVPHGNMSGNNVASREVHHHHGSSNGLLLGDLDEPIYEEIGDLNRSTSPIYADAFDAKSIFDGASRNEILSFLESIRDRLAAAESNSTDSAASSLNRSKKCRKIVDIERNDSGIGSESGSLLAVNSSKANASHRLCSDCNDAPVDPRLTATFTSVTTSTSPCLTMTTVNGECSSNLNNNGNSGRSGGQTRALNLCRSCSRKRSEKKEILQEIYETELKYGRDLKIIEDEFYNPIQIAGLLTKEQLDQIFLNVDQLVEINLQLTSMIKSAMDAAQSTHDDDLTTVNVGKIFIDYGETMMSAFESYCTRQANAGALLTQLEKEKELLRIFLRVSQMENTVLRRMNLPAFLMVPVQRVTRYPLLLARLLKVTPVDHFSREELYSAQQKIEQHLEHMNKTTREVASVKLWRRISIMNGSNSPVHRRSNSDLDGAVMRIRKMALDVLDWANFTDVTCVIESQLNVVQFNGKTLRNIYGCLLARGKDLESLACKMEQDVFFPPAEDVVKDVKLVLVRVKNTRFCLLREPLCLSKCVISQGENEFQDFIEINEIITKNTYYFQGMEKHGTLEWLRLLQCHAVCVGQWRRRRGALANIMMNGMIRHV